MEKTLSKQQILAIEKIKRSQQAYGKKTSLKSTQATIKTTPTKITTAAHHEPYFPATAPYFYGTRRPAEAREKSARLIKLLDKFKKNSSKKHRTIKIFSFSKFEIINKK